MGSGEKMKNKADANTVKLIKRLVIFLIALVIAVNFNFIFFSFNLRKTITPDFSVSNVTVSEMDYLFDESNPINLIDLIDSGNISVFEAIKVLINPDKYCFVTARLEISNHTGKDIYDWDYFVHQKSSLFYAAGINDLDSPLFCPILDGEKSATGIHFIVPKKSVSFDSIQKTEDTLPSSVLDGFTIKVKAADLRKDWNYDEFYGE